MATEARLRLTLAPCLMLLLMVWSTCWQSVCAAHVHMDNHIPYPTDYKAPGLQNRHVRIRPDVANKPMRLPSNTTEFRMESKTESLVESRTASIGLQVPTTMETAIELEIGPRITLDTLPICAEGSKLVGNHCRKKA